ncbi:MAG: OadG family protein, partial [Lachnospiraceae bacterium]|nr:OadG family protein [Lachnospiraceae bacterium]
TDEQLDEVITNGLTPDGTNSKTIAYNWRAIKKELGSVVEITEQTVSEEGSVVTVENKVVYDLPSENTDVLVTYTADFNKLDNTKTDKIYETLTWDIRYPFSKLIAEAGLNTFLGLGTVFVVLIFLSFVISRMKLLANIGTKAAPAAAAPASTAASAAPPVIEEEEEAVDDTELIAVIAAAIAASENTSTDGFVVRSIKKVNRRNRQRG